ncbi:MAG: DUF4860 domain-containing protein [Defluviitaleaceae bacterium]|nr:DUF4860 domain-containing protein [Defluviitaleaceae bacterium]
MLKKYKTNNKIDTVFVLMVFCIFAVSVFLVLILSASTYSNINDIASEGQNERIVLSYIRTKIRQNDRADAITITDFHGQAALSMHEDINGRNFYTLIYYYNGGVYELFYESGLEFLPQDGIRIIGIDYLSFEIIEEGLLRVNTNYGSTLILPRSSAISQREVLD